MQQRIQQELQLRWLERDSSDRKWLIKRDATHLGALRMSSILMFPASILIPNPDNAIPRVACATAGGGLRRTLFTEEDLSPDERPPKNLPLELKDNDPGSDVTKRTPVRPARQDAVLRRAINQMRRERARKGSCKSYLEIKYHNPRARYNLWHDLVFIYLISSFLLWVCYKTYQCNGTKSLHNNGIETSQ
eukprot:2430630-Rhodomonas_salina.5